jgi:hypothetical protein
MDSQELPSLVDTVASEQKKTSFFEMFRILSLTGRAINLVIPCCQNFLHTTLQEPTTTSLAPSHNLFLGLFNYSVRSILQDDLKDGFGRTHKQEIITYSRIIKKLN